jgi:hypothetical protein
MLHLGVRAAYIAPFVWTLTAQQAAAAGSNPSALPSCLEDGKLCGKEAKAWSFTFDSPGSWESQY